MKKAICIFLSCIMIFGILIFPVNAVSIKEGADECKKNMLDGKCSNGIDYVFYSPVKDSKDEQKYPLMVWLHGINSGKGKRSQIDYYDFPNWSTDEYQKRFQNAGGCFLFAPRSDNLLNDWSIEMTGILKDSINAFVATHQKNIDTDRIYIGGYSTGGEMVWNIITQYPDYFAAALPLASISQPLSFNSLANISIWMMSCDQDPYIGGRSSAAQMTFASLENVTTRSKDCLRFTTFSEAVLANGEKKPNDWAAEHYIWEAVTYDMHMSDGITPYKYATTIDGNNNIITFENPEIGVIDWLSQQKRTNLESESSFFNTIKKFFQRIFSVFMSIFHSFFSEIQ